MIVEDQEAAIAFLLDPTAYGETGSVEAIETHISRIYLVGERAYKMKRAVKLPYVDFSTAALRLAACEKEVELNSKTAPRPLSWACGASRGSPTVASFSTGPANWSMR